MNIKELRALLERFPDEAEVSISLDASGTETEFSAIRVSWEGPSGEGETGARCVHLEDKIADNVPFFDGQIRLGLPGEFYALCAKVGITPAAVLHAFIADLCGLSADEGPRSDGLTSNGSDEQMLARQYFERCDYRHRLEAPGVQSQRPVPRRGPAPT